MSTSKKKSDNGFLNFIKSQDMFGETFRQTIDGDHKVVHSYMGSFCSLIVFVLTLSYASFKFNVLLEN